MRSALEPSKATWYLVKVAKRGLGAWLYDEDRWPSGFAGGIVPARSEEYRTKAILMCMSGRLYDAKEAVRIFKCDLVNGGPENLKPVAEGEDEERGKTYLYFNLYTAPIGNIGYSGYSYIDVLSPKAVKAFIESTYEAYYKRVGRWFGSSIPGIFTDEPNLIGPFSNEAFRDWVRGLFHISSSPIYTLPWTRDLPEYFLKKKGYDLRDHLPGLFFNVNDFTKVRYDYWNTVTDLYVEAYSKQLYDWCDRHNLKLTGHYLLEDTLMSQLRAIGAAMPHYEYQHIPGIDHIGKNIAQPLTVKQVSSVAEQLGKERVLTETLSFGGFTFEDRKWIGDWHYVLGINFLNQHLSLYSMRGLRKRDCPPNLFYQQPWWRYNQLIADYYARLSYALSRGKRTVDIMVLHPIASAWAVYTPLNAGEVEKLDHSLEWLIETLLENHRDFELGDETIIRRHGKVDGIRLAVGRSSYRAVIIPPSKTLSRSTLKILNEYANKGGMLIAINPAFSMVEGRESNEIKGLLKNAVEVENRDEENLLKALERLPSSVKINIEDGQPARKVWYNLRREGGQQILFMANIDREKEYETMVKIGGTGNVEEWNLFNGEVQAVPSRFEEGYIVVDLYFPPVGSHLLVIDEKKEPLAHKKKATIGEINEIAMGEKWRFKRLDPNVLTLDRCKIKFENGQYSELIPVWRAYTQMRSRQPIGPIVSTRIGSAFGVRYEFESGLESISSRQIYLVLENPEKYSIRVNGEEIEYKDIGYWVDTTFSKIDIKNLVRHGKNTVEISGKIDFETEIENCYIIGDFGVENAQDKSFKLIEEQKELESSNIVYQGYPFFAGTISYTQDFDVPEKKGKALLEIENLNAVVTKVLLNGNEAGYIFVKPHELDVTDLIEEGTNTLEIQITNDLRNTGIQRMFMFMGFGPEEVHFGETQKFVPTGVGKARIKLLGTSGEE